MQRILLPPSAFLRKTGDAKEVPGSRLSSSHGRAAAAQGHKGQEVQRDSQHSDRSQYYTLGWTHRNRVQLLAPQRQINTAWREQTKWTRFGGTSTIRECSLYSLLVAMPSTLIPLAQQADCPSRSTDTSNHIITIISTTVNTAATAGAGNQHQITSASPHHLNREQNHTRVCCRAPPHALHR